MKAIIELGRRGSVFKTASQQLVASRRGQALDYRLSFESARRQGACSVYALAKAAERNYSNVHTDVSRLEELGLIERANDGSISVPFEAVEIRLALAQVA